MIDLDAVLRLCTVALGAPPAARLLDRIAGAGGDPQWTQALIAGLRDEGRIRLDDGLAVLSGDDPDHLPERVLDLARSVLAARRPDCRQLLSVAAVLGPALDLDRIAEMVGRPTAALLPAWQEALDADLLRPSDSDLVFVHEVLRQAVAASLPAAIRRALVRQHEQAAPPVSTSDPEPAAHHLAGRLTAREQTVMALVARGRSNQQIARSLGISSHAVKRHVSNLLIKFDCSNRTEVALLAVAPQRA